VFLASNFLVPNATFVVELIAFLIVLGLLGRYVLPPVTKAMDDRQQVIRQSLADAETAKRKAEEAETDYRATLDKAKAEARAIVDEANKAAEALRASRKEQGEQEYQRIVSRAQTDIEASRRRAAEDVRRDVSTLVLAVVERVVGEGFDAAGHSDLIDRTVGEVEAQAASAPEVDASRA
jgi:F-type H+-transporting ATPase subunit b